MWPAANDVRSPTIPLNSPLGPDATTLAPRGLVATVDQLASSAGLALLRAGGSAADAAVGASAVLAVTTQHMCGMGGDLLAVVHPGRGRGAPQALLAVGRAGSGADADALRAEGHAAMPFRGDIRTVTVPGCVDGWLALHARHGRLPLAEVLAPARDYARDGFPVSPLLAAAVPRIADVAGADDYLAGGLPAAGDRRRRPGLARALDAIADAGREAWYAGEFGQGLLRLAGGYFSADDLARPQAEWADPLAVEAFGGRLWSTPAPSHGYLTLASAAVTDRLWRRSSPPPADDPAWAHLLIEASRLTGYDRNERLGDGAPADRLLDPADLDRRAALFGDQAAELDVPGTPGGTIYLCAVDADGMAVSLSQSNAAGFGAHLTVPAVGVFLQNRGVGFSLRPGAPNEYAAGRRPNHTLAPALVTGPNGDPRAVLGTMGGDAQPQVLLQLLARLAAGASPAEALAAPRWALAGTEGTGFDTWDARPGARLRQLVRVEGHAPDSWDDGLRRRGHQVDRVPAGSGFGHAQLAVLREDGVIAGAADPRAGTGAAAGW